MPVRRMDEAGVVALATALADPARLALFPVHDRDRARQRLPRELEGTVTGRRMSRTRTGNAAVSVLAERQPGWGS